MFSLQSAFSTSKCEDCDGTAYDPSSDQCCGGKVIAKSSECCGDESAGEEAGTNGCCDISALDSGEVCCDGQTPETGDSCCSVYALVDGKDLCCENNFHPDAIETFSGAVCCGLDYTKTANEGCCNSSIFILGTDLCCFDKYLHTGAADPLAQCCGSSYTSSFNELCCSPSNDMEKGKVIDKTKDLCCNGSAKMGARDSYSGAECCGSSFTTKVTEKCCNDLSIYSTEEKDSGVTLTFTATDHIKSRISSALSKLPRVGKIEITEAELNYSAKTKDCCPSSGDHAVDGIVIHDVSASLGIKVEDFSAYGGKVGKFKLEDAGGLLGVEFLAQTI